MEFAWVNGMFWGGMRVTQGKAQDVTEEAENDSGKLEHRNVQTVGKHG
jgi:hypothetical protein